MFCGEAIKLKMRGHQNSPSCHHSDSLPRGTVLGLVNPRLVPHFALLFQRMWLMLFCFLFFSAVYKELCALCNILFLLLSVSNIRLPFVRHATVVWICAFCVCPYLYPLFSSLRRSCISYGDFFFTFYHFLPTFHHAHHGHFIFMLCPCPRCMCFLRFTKNQSPPS